MSREAWQRIVDSYEAFDPRRLYDDRVCMYGVSKVIEGVSRVEMHQVQKCDDCKTLKRAGDYRMEIESGACDAEISREILNGEAMGQLVSAYCTDALASRGGMSGSIKWAGSGATLVGRMFAALNAGTHHDPLRQCERCHSPGHAEGWLRTAIVEGDHTGCRVNGSLAFDFDAQEEGARFHAVFEGLLICQCDE